MRRLLDAEQQKEQPAHVMRQDIPEDSGHKQEHGQKDLTWGEEEVKARQTSRRLKLLMCRLWEDERQREGAERELRNLISQVQDYKQERAENDAVQQREDTLTKSSDPRHKKSQKGQGQVRKDRANEQNSAGRQTAQQRAANSAEETSKIDSSRSHSGYDRDSSRTRRNVMPDCGEESTNEYESADKRKGQEAVASCEQASMRLERRVEKVNEYLCTMGTCWMKCIMLLVAVYGSVPICLLNPLYLKTHIADGIAISCIMTCCVLLIMSPAPNQMAEVGQNAPAPTNNFDMQLGARTKDWEDTTVTTKRSKCSDWVAQILNWFERISVAVGVLSICVALVVQWGASMGEMGNETVATLRNVAWTAFTYALTCGGMAKVILFIFVVSLQSAAAYSVAGIGHGGHAPAIYSAMHLRARARLDPAVWAPVESSFGGEHNSLKSAKWAWGEV